MAKQQYKQVGVVENDEFDDTHDLDVYGGTSASASASQKRCCCCALTPQSTIFSTFLLTSIFTVSQFIASIISGSLALLGDSISMAVDSLTYGLNWWAAREKARLPLDSRTKTVELCVSLCSSAWLLIACSFLFFESWLRLTNVAYHAKIAQIDPNTIIAFASANLVVDVISVSMFFRQRQSFYEAGDDDDNMRTSSSSRSRSATTSTSNAKEANRSTDQLDLNFSSAFAHSCADFLRTVAELVAGTLVKIYGWDSVKTDAKCAVVVAFLIAAPAVYLLSLSITRTLRHLATGGREVQNHYAIEAEYGFAEDDELELAEVGRVVGGAGFIQDQSPSNGVAAAPSKISMSGLDEMDDEGLRRMGQELQALAALSPHSPQLSKNKKKNFNISLPSSGSGNGKKKKMKKKNGQSRSR